MLEASKLNLIDNKQLIIIAKLGTPKMRKNLIRATKSQKLNTNILYRQLETKKNLHQ